jgi:SulP family sulfate permease
MASLKPNRLTFDNFRGDLYGGLTAGIVALPLALAFGVASGMGPIAGLYGAIFVGFFAALFGGTPSQVSGPTGPMTIVAASIFTQFGSEPALGFTVVIMAGGFQMLFGYLKLGRYVNLMPYPVISGFMTGIGCIIIIMQLDPLLGYASQQTVINALSVLPDYIYNPNLHAIIIGLAAIIIVIWTPKKLAHLVPTPLLALLVCSVLGLLLTDAPRLGEVPSGLPSLVLPQIDFALLNQMLISAVVLAALGSIDSLLTSLVADNMTRTFHDSDKELVGQGLANMIAGFTGSLPGAGASIRTITNIKAGGRTVLSGMIHAVILFVIALGLGSLVAFVPIAALAGIMMKVGIDVIDWRFIRRMHRAPRVDFVLMVIVLALTVFVNVITAVAAGVVLASLAFVKEMAELQVENIRTVSHPDDEGLFDAEGKELFRRCHHRAMILHLSGLISFGAASELTRKFATVGSYDLLIIDLEDVPRVDGSAALALEEIIQLAHESDKHVFVVGLTLQVARVMGQIGALNLVKETSRFNSRNEALRAAVQLVESASGIENPKV